ncbi:hypothetical protein V2J09_007912 [Rumex salicifolius]
MKPSPDKTSPAGPHQGITCSARGHLNLLLCVFPNPRLLVDSHQPSPVAASPHQRPARKSPPQKKYSFNLRSAFLNIELGSVTVKESNR